LEPKFNKKKKQAASSFKKIGAELDMCFLAMEPEDDLSDWVLNNPAPPTSQIDKWASRAIPFVSKATMENNVKSQEEGRLRMFGSGGDGGNVKF
jgi:hypothetical protein